MPTSFLDIEPSKVGRARMTMTVRSGVHGELFLLGVPF